MIVDAFSAYPIAIAVIFDVFAQPFQSNHIPLNNRQQMHKHRTEHACEAKKAHTQLGHPKSMGRELLRILSFQKKIFKWSASVAGHNSFLIAFLLVLV